MCESHPKITIPCRLFSCRQCPGEWKISENSGQCLDPRNIVLPCPFCQNATLVTGTNCNGYGVWINKTEHSGLDLILFNRLRESWRASRESWHLSREHITSNTWRTSPESWHLSHKYNTPVNTQIWSGLKGTLARGKHPQPSSSHEGPEITNHPSAHEGAENTNRPSAPTTAPLSPAHTQGFSNLPKDRPGLGETAYTSEPSLCTNGVLLPNTQVGRVSLLNTGGSTSTLRTLPNIGWPVETGRTIH